ncbi:MAG: Organic solvent tolerance protein OstA [Cyclobacteriaceae bacterium]|nr:Organic solvent tolerance protein OstA [Cyclobacteriaceae bacterium]
MILNYEAKSHVGGTKDGLSYHKLVGDVKFTQKNTIIYCDTAMFYDLSNSLEAFGNVRIEDMDDSVTITSDKLYYQGNDKVAKLRGDVVYVDDSIRLYTDHLNYDMINKSAKYEQGGKIIDGVNVLESIYGNYDTEGKMMMFRDSVKLITPDYTLESDDLIYNMITKKARASSENTITTKDGKVLKSYQGSEFDTGRNSYAFLVGEIDTDKYFLKGDELYFDDQLGSYSAIGNVYLLAKQDSIVITGNTAHFWQDQGLAKVYGEPLLKKQVGIDTLYLRADTLVSIDDSLEANKRLLAYNHVKIFKADLQGKADSLAYFLSDSSMTFYNDPVLWNEGSQITADTINIIVKSGSIEKLEAGKNSFIISEDSTSNYNQIKGRRMTAYFEGKNISNVDVLGNGETIYFVADDENKKILIGMNKIVCSNMNIRFKENQVNDIRFYTKPDGSIVPPHELKDDQKKLDGFSWRIAERPTKREILTAPSEIERKTRQVEEMIEAEQHDQPEPEEPDRQAAEAPQ